MTPLYCPACGSTELTLLATKTQAGSDRWRCRQCGARTCFPAKESPDLKFEFQQDLPKSNRYVVTTAQNATPVHKKFFASLLQYCDHNNAQLIVIPTRYKNPTSEWTGKQESDEWWSDVLAPYLFAGRGIVNKNLVILGDIKIQVTASKPLTGFETISGKMSCVIGHPKLEMKCIATPHDRLPKICITTGAVTIKNYTDSKHGKKGEFHHTFGALVIEVDGDAFHTRQINALRNGSFIDWDKRYTPEGVEDAPPAAGLVMGDWHHGFTDPCVEEATFGKGGIVETLNPQVLIWHDVLDGYARNPHHRDNVFIEIAKRSVDKQCVKNEVFNSIEYIVKRTVGRKSLVVPSNHNDFLNRWLLETDWRRDPDNAEFYLETALAMVRSTKMTAQGSEYVDPFSYWVQRTAPKDVIVLQRDASFEIKGVEVNYHGDHGANGSRGSINAYRRIGARTVIGHSHSPGIQEGCYQVGTSSFLKLEYNEGLTAWLQTHCVIYANGKRSLINIIDGKCRA